MSENAEGEGTPRRARISLTKMRSLKIWLTRISPPTPRAKISLKQMRSLKVNIKRIDHLHHIPSPSTSPRSSASTSTSEPSRSKFAQSIVRKTALINKRAQGKAEEFARQTGRNRTIKSTISSNNDGESIFLNSVPKEWNENLRKDFVDISTSVLGLKKDTVVLHGSSNRIYGARACARCGLTFQNYRSFRSHDRKCYRKSQKHECKICGLEFGALYKLKLHNRIHTGGKIYSCNHCTSTFTQSSSLNDHERKIHPEHPTSHTSIPCEECGQEFANRIKLKIHQRVHSGGNVYPCKVCEEIFSSNSNLRSHHRRLHPDEPPLDEESSCEICGLQFENAFKLQRHSKIHTDENVLTCKICALTFSNPRGLRRHILRVHGVRTVSIYKCTTCGMRFKDLPKLRMHSRIHSGGEAFPCQFCDSVFSNKYILRNHEKKSHPDKAPTEIVIPCEVCGLEFENSMRLKLHSRIHKGIRIYSCQKCTASFSKNSALRQHYLKRHPEEAQLHSIFPCTVCGLIFENNQKLKLHSRVHTDENIIQCKHCTGTFTKVHTIRLHMQKEHPGQDDSYLYFPCGDCDAIFPTEMKWKIHSRIHAGGKLFYCEHCSSTFTTKRNMLDHMKKSHPEITIPTITCEECGAEFENEYSLKLHARIHTDVTVVTCQFCSTVLSNFSKLRRHMKSIHPEEEFDEYIYNCEDCGMKFDSQAKLKVHSRIHTEETVPTCEVCILTFSNPRTLLTHMKNIHPEHFSTYFPLSCEKCDMKFQNRLELKLHERIHVERNKYPCKVCGTRFGSVGNLRAHLKKRHPDHGPTYFMWPCGVCGLEFQNRFKLKLHSRVHKDGNIFPCSLCTANFKNSYGLQAHMKSIHPDTIAQTSRTHTMRTRQKPQRAIYLEDEKIHTCRLCGMHFDVEVRLNLHIRSEHPEHVTSVVVDRQLSPEKETFSMESSDEVEVENLHSESSDPLAISVGEYLSYMDQFYANMTMTTTHESSNGTVNDESEELFEDSNQPIYTTIEEVDIKEEPEDFDSFLSFSNENEEYEMHQDNISIENNPTDSAIDSASITTSFSVELIDDLSLD